MLRIRVCGAAVAVILAASPAMAHDYNWSGLYLGAHGGYGWGDTEYPGLNPYVAPPATCSNAFGPGQHCGPPRPNMEGGSVGGQIGYNVQLSNVVIGVEADYSFAHMEQSLRDGNYIVQTHEITGLGSIRGRLGYSFGRILPYATAGWAWGRTGFGQSCPDPISVAAVNTHCSVQQGFAPYNNTKNETVTGWVYGGGVEAAIVSNWSLRAEYLRYDFDTQSYALGATPSGRDLGSKKLQREIDTVRIGVNYRFGGAAADPVSLK
ncbi:outer membrane protein [Hyphomicrobium sulfonivorans]|uniref:outer membrane protein n=1 Tax=Hyphomicrobium sulfonivorans TaxID=121290 RepID=UPI00156EB6B9|nr:outer membrane protein [Hyphomicrobium sulfonivorans]MBI1649843.1 porin family protein [Hyphomicrobium sulfonivorans]NSL71756.1 hypothetical protein [Hyphomicrobium sulfonivorans]